MYNPINLSTNILKRKSVINSLNINPFNESTDFSKTNADVLYTEAVFTDGKNQLSKITECIQKAKDLLDQKINEQDESIKEKANAPKYSKSKIKIKNFDPTAFWRDQVFKDLEDEIQKVFGFRSVEIQPFIEKYNSKDKQFQTRTMNAFVYHSDRYPIDGLVTDKGFYDKTHSLVMDIRISLGLIKALDSEEILAVLLHEFGHNVDPAIVDINYSTINALSKYLTDRKKDLTKSEEKALKENKSKFGMLILLPLIWMGIIYGIVKISDFLSWIKEKIIGKDKAIEKDLNKIKKVLSKDNEEFNRQNYSEAFADNFARMYGFGPKLMSALKKMNDDNDDAINSIYKKDIDRRKAIISITIDCIKDVHKTEIHRIHSLIKEYKNDIADPNIPNKVKEGLKEDLKELENILDQYLNHKDEFQKRVNNLINDELNTAAGTNNGHNTEEAIKEGFEFFDENLITESKKAYEELKKREETINSSERAKIKEKFGDSKECSFAKDKDGYYCYTHRCRSKSYPTIEDIPMKDVKFVRSTS